MRAILADRFGSYSMDSTLAEIPSFALLKSIIRYDFLCPPPRCLDVSLPLLFRPPLETLGSVKGLYGLSEVISSNEYPVLYLDAGVVGLYFLTAIIKLPQKYRVYDQDAE